MLAKTWIIFKIFFKALVIGVILKEVEQINNYNNQREFYLDPWIGKQLKLKEFIPKNRALYNIYVIVDVKLNFK